MIRISVEPDTLVAGQPSVLTIGLSNTGLDTCSDVIFRLKLPPGMALVSGRDRIDVDEIRAGQVHVHSVTLLPGRPGDVEVGTSNFSYRDEDGITRRQDDWRAAIRVLATRPAQNGPARSSSPGRSHARPRLTVSHRGGKLAINEWHALEILLRNETGIPLHDVGLTVAGPFRADPASARIQLLPDGETWRPPISVHVPDRGQVPVSIRTAYRYRDECGQLSTRAQDDRLTVEVATPAGTVSPRHQKAPVTTILYLVAQPADTDPLGSYQEMREVEKLLQLGRDRERYRLEHCVAARLRDISQALGDYKPQIVHFAGHGSPDGRLAVENNAGRASLVNPAGLASLLGGFAESVQCVIVNACHSLALAEATSKQIDYAIGMRSEILDLASIQFSVGFYQGLFAGKTVPGAFRQGCALVQAEPVTNLEHKVPILFSRRST
jgi:CHAT domain